MKYTEEQIKKFAKETYPGGSDISRVGRISYVAGFKKAMELMHPPATKTLSEITDGDFIELSFQMGLASEDFVIERRPTDVHLKTETQECTLFLKTEAFITMTLIAT